MNENGSLPTGSFNVSPTEDAYSLYTGLAFRRKTFLPFRLRKSCSHSCVKRMLLTNVAVSIASIVIVLILSLVLGLYALLWVEPQPVIDISFNAFTVPNHQVTRHQEAFDVAVSEYNHLADTNHRSRRSALDSKDITVLHRHKRYVQYHRKQKVLLVYLAIGGTDDNIFTPERIETIHRVEMDIVRMPGFSDLCYKGYPKQGGKVQCCHALNSMVSRVFYGTSTCSNLDDDNAQLVNDFEGAVHDALSTGFLYTDGHASQSFLKSTFLRSEVSFGMPLPGLFLLLWVLRGVVA